MPPIEADFWGHPQSGYSKLELEFHDLSQGLVNDWEWEFGDGETSTEQNPLHPYFSPRAGSPISQWTSTDSTSLYEVSFTSTSVGSPTSFLWDFGDGEISIDENPVHPFPKDDVYLVKLTIFNAIGNSTTENCVVVGS